MADQTSGFGPLSDDGESGPTTDESTLAGRDQTLADADQTGSDTDQTAAESDQEAADRDQDASDADLAQGGDEAVHAESREVRDRSAQARRSTASERLAVAASRDEIALARDRDAQVRDQQADRRDHDLASRESAWRDRTGAREGAKILLRAFDARRRAASGRDAAAEARRSAAVDRQRAAADREQAARDRAQARADRETLVEHLAAAEVDALTGARTRGAGLADLEHEIDRARRAASSLVVVYIDVVKLKAVNDAEGHPAGDAVLARVVATVRAQLRSYDVIVRVGGDEFVCVMSRATVDDAEQRFRAVEAKLAAAPRPCAIRIGVAAYEAGDTVDELIGRADAKLPRGHRR